MEKLAKQGLLKDMYRSKRCTSSSIPKPSMVTPAEDSSFIQEHAAFNHIPEEDNPIEYDEQNNEYYQWTEDEGETSSVCSQWCHDSEVGSPPPVSSHSFKCEEVFLKRNKQQPEDPVIYSGPQLLFDTVGDCVF
jgi:hypothetical protein